LQLMDYTANLGGPGDVGDHRSPATSLVPFTPELVPDKRTLHLLETREVLPSRV
ncbi:hypothetical protein E4U25_000828, partial [Claviceps purpurea]